MRDFSKSEYAKSVAAADAKIKDADRYRCRYTSCSAGGTICESTMGPGKGEEDSRQWLCLAHYRLRDDPLGSREALADLIAHPAKPPEDWREKMLLEHGLGELQTAWRDMDQEEKRAFIAETIRKAKVFVCKTVAPPQESRSAGTIHIDPAERTRQLDALYRAMSPEQRAEYNPGAG